MKRLSIATAAALTGLLLLPAAAQADASPACRALPALPGSPADPSGDVARAALCGIDFASPDVAVCPKNWSTSAAALIYDVQGTQWDGNGAKFEAEVCSRGTHAREASAGELAIFKHSMNDRETSGTYAPAALLYDHLSRWLGTEVNVPVAVEQHFPASWYDKRVVQPGLALAHSHHASKMLIAAWTLLDEIIENPTQHPEAPELFLDDRKTLWGANLLFTGQRYGPEINGTRESGWGAGQNHDFQHTAPFLLLRNPQSLATAVTDAIADARRDPTMAKALPADVNPVQVMWWANEILEIVVLDYLLGQQDRVGNIDAETRWIWLADGEVHSRPIHSESAPHPSAQRMEVSWLNDNDAGLRASYANFARKTGMLEELRHFNPRLYRRLRELAADFREQGPVYQAISRNYHLRSSELKSVAQRVAEVDAIIARDCEAGRYRFDLDPRVFLAAGASVATDVACE